MTGEVKSPYCDYCKKIGHIKAKCYKLIGYPPRDKDKGTISCQGQQQNSTYNRQSYNRGKGLVVTVHGNSDEFVSAKGDAGGHEVPKEQVLSLSKEQYSQPLGMMQQYQDQNANVNTAAINFAGMITCTTSIDFDSLSCSCLVPNSAATWILDSGASNHVAYNKDLLIDLKPFPSPILLTLPNGYKVKVTQVGDAVVAARIILHKVLLVPDFRYNCLVFFTDKVCIVQAPSMKRPLEIGRVKKNLYVVC